MRAREQHRSERAREGLHVTAERIDFYGRSHVHSWLFVQLVAADSNLDNLVPFGAEHSISFHMCNSPSAAYTEPRAHPRHVT